MKKLLSIGSLFVLVVTLSATTINIPADYPTIQAGIDASSNGDTVLVSAGTYVENINYNGKNIVVGSLYLTTSDTSYISSTIIDGNQSTSVVTFNSSETSSAQLIGLTVQNGNANDGGGIYCGNSCTPTLDHLYVVNNTANQFGGGIYLDVAASATITHSLISNNQASGNNGNGGGIGGTGLFLNATIQNCTIVGNAAWESGSGIYIQNTNPSSTNVQIINTILRNEQLLASWLDYYEEISSQQDGSTEQNDANFTVSYSLVRGGWSGTGILDVDPEFVDEVNGDYHLTVSSPCIDAGDPNSEYDPDGTIADMGTYYYHQEPPGDIYGCTDPLADNYNPDATIDDGSCEYPDNGDYSLSFDGIDYVEVGNDSDFDIDNTVTIEAWIKPTSLSNRYGIFTTRRDNEPGSFQLEVGTSDLGSNYVAVSGISSWVAGTGDNAISIGEWTHIAYTRNGTGDNHAIYVNGIAQMISTNSYTFVNNDALKEIGRGTDQGQHYNGQIDGLSIWNVVLTQEEIQSYMTTAPAGNEEGLAGYWKFNAGDEDILYDHSGNQNHGEINGATWVENIYGCTDSLAGNFNPEANWDDGSCTDYPDNGDYSLSFDGVDDYTDMGGPVINQPSALTVSGWFKVNSTSSTNYIFNHGNGGEVKVFINSGSLVAWIKTTTGYLNQLTVSVTTGQWYHYAVSFENNSAIKLYLDGSEVQSHSIDNVTLYSSGGNLTFGMSNNEDGNPFSGLIDEVAVWDDALTDAEITALYNFHTPLDASSNSGNYESSSNLQGYWKFNAGEGDILYDHSGNQNHGTIYGATWVENIYGCTDSLAGNFNPEANWDDGSCTDYPDNGDYSLSFDGVDDYVEVEGSENLDGMNALTLQFWVKFNEYSLDYNKGIGLIYKKQTGVPANPDVSYDFYTHHDADVLTFLVRGGENDWNTVQLYNFSNYIELHTWYLFTGVYDSTSIKLYINGELIDENYSENGIVYHTPYTLQFANTSSNTNTKNFFGNLSNIIILNDVLTQSEIQSYMNTELLDSEEDLVSYWKFNAGEGETLYDHSGNQNHGTIVGATWVENVYGCTDSLATNYNPEADFDDGSCEYPDNGEFHLSFDGVDDYVDMDDPVDGDLDVGDSDFTLETFIKVSDGQIDTYGSLISKRYSEQGNGYALIINNSGNVCAEILKLGAGNGYTEFCGDVNVVDAQWNHISAVFDRDDNATIYINGINDASENITEQIGNIDNDMVFKIGDKSTGSRHYNGLIDNVRIWKRALTQEEIQSNISNNPINEDELAANWKFNAGEDSILYDHSGNQNHGTIYGATWVENIYGCTDSLATNYNPEADFDDGSCEYPDNGEFHLSFDGVDDYASINGTVIDNVFSGTQAFTVALWVYGDGGGNDGIYKSIINKGNTFSSNGNPSTFMLLKQGVGTITCILFTDANNWIGAGMLNGTLNSDAWNHIVVTYNGGNTHNSLSFYVNSTSVSPIEGTNFGNYTGMDYNTDSFNFGARKYQENSTFYFWDSKIDETAIWNYALTQSEIQSYMTTPPVGNEEGIVANWKFNAGEGDILYDHSGNQNHGTINGATWINIAPIIQNIEDVPNDQGGKVFVDFLRSFYDTDGLDRIESYQIEVFYEDQWVGVATQNAYNDSTYRVLVSTISDSSSSSDGVYDYRVIANMEEGNFVSETATGYSVDNIAPAVPTNLLLTYSGDMVVLTWDLPVDEDFQYFSVYRNGELADYTIEPEFMEIQSGAEYYVTATDANGNESEPSETASGYSVDVVNLLGWNLVGLPLEVEDANYLILFPDAIENTLFSFDDAYTPDSTLIHGEGYWLRFEEAGSTTITGTPINAITLSLNADWNLISGITEAVSVYAIDDPDGIIIENTLFGFTDAYFVTEELLPAEGYWIRTFEAGDITLTSDATARIASLDYSLNANSISINGSELYFGVELSDKKRLSYSLPPKPPAGAFDVRFKDSWRLVKNYGVVEVMPTTETLTIAYNIMLNAGEHHNWVLTATSGEEYILENAGELTIPSAERFTLELRAIVPATFTLHQNFPNPFNPITTLRYDLPEDNFVMLTVYNMLGRTVVQLVNTAQEAGFKSVQWDATDSMGRPVSAGVYLYQIQAGEFVQTKKMVLLK